MKKVSKLFSVLIMAILITAPFMSFATEKAFDARPESDELTEVTVIGSVEELSEESEAAYDNDAFFTIDASNIITNRHNVINVALRIPSCIKNSFVVINANYCFDCDRFFISSDEYEYYRSIYPIMLIKFEYVSADENAIGHNLAEKSPLMMAGYTVRATLNYSDVQRQSILKNIIELGILKKHEVISYLNYFISMNGNARGMENAVAKWGKDLDFVRTHNFEEQKRGKVEDIKKWL